ncbi:hypothetical protein [Novosphingobium sp.]|uniref:hypothetical protein n=1 Tax=Novosphingobium sp. TaxID=1874826 RepID=UPI002607EA31|nr:hypothetical protein [Novosphingobium sp.]
MVRHRATSQYAAIPSAAIAITPQTTLSSDSSAKQAARPVPARSGINKGVQHAAQAMARPAMGSFDFIWRSFVQQRFATFYKFK